MGMVLKFSFKMPLETAIKQFSVLSHLKVCLLADGLLCQICGLKSRYADCNTLNAVYVVLSLDFSLKTEAHQIHKLKGVSPRDNPTHIPHKKPDENKNSVFLFCNTLLIPSP